MFAYGIFKGIAINENRMIKSTFKSFCILALSCSAFAIYGQNMDDSIADGEASRIIGKLKHFSFNFYVDAYCNITFGGPNDTSEMIPFSANSPVHNQIRLNVAAFEMYYNAEKVRGKFVLQYGDMPNLLTDANSEWVKTIRQANFGLRIVKDLWVDVGYIFNPVEYESAWPIVNEISYVTVGAYFAPGSVLGVKLSYKFSEKFSGGIMAGNPFSIAYAENTRLAGIMFLTYRPLSNLSITYNNFFGNQALKTAEIDNNILYNNFIADYTPGKHFELTGQFDLGGQTNSTPPPDTNDIATMFSGFFQVKYKLNQHFSGAVRYEVFNDPDGFLSGVNPLTNRGLRTDGLGISLEYRPVPFGFFRLIYHYLHSYPGSKEFYSKTSDNLNAILFSTGVRF
jgi:hypothetical protein